MPRNNLTQTPAAEAESLSTEAQLALVTSTLASHLAAYAELAGISSEDDELIYETIKRRLRADFTPEQARDLIDYGYSGSPSGWRHRALAAESEVVRLQAKLAAIEAAWRDGNLNRLSDAISG